MAVDKKKVLMVQSAEEERNKWYVALTSQMLEVSWQPASIDMVEYLKSLQADNEVMPNLLLMDSGITGSETTALRSRAVCRWCSQNLPGMPVILNNPRQEYIGRVERGWATRQGAIDLLPSLSETTLTMAVSRIMEVLNLEFFPDRLQQVAKSIIIATAAPESVKTSAIEREKMEVLRDAKTQALARKLAIIPTLIDSDESEVTPVEAEADPTKISMQSTVKDLLLYDTSISIEALGVEASRAFNENPLLPGLLLDDRGKYCGMISRRRFSEFMGRRYAIELFAKRPLRMLYEHSTGDILILNGDISVSIASQLAMDRTPELIYEPIVVRLESDEYRLLDVHDLNLAQAQVHALATKMLRQEIKSQMVQTEKMVTLGQIVSEIAQDFSKPVAAIQDSAAVLSEYAHAMVRLLTMYEEEFPAVGDRLDKARRELEIERIKTELPQLLQEAGTHTGSLAKLTSGLQTYAAPDRDVAGPIDVAECLESSLAILDSRLNGTVQVVKEYGDPPHALGFAGLLVQALLNLLGNAIDAVRDVRVDELVPVSGFQPRQAWQPTIRITTKLQQRDGKEWVAIAVADNGNSIPKEMQERIFDAFAASKAAIKGAGLGLAVCHQIVTQKHQGRLNVRSPIYSITVDGVLKGNGTEYEILLPRA